MPKLCLYFPKHFEDPNWAGSSYTLEAPEGDHSHKGEWIVGRHPAADLTLAIRSISAKHCTLSYSYADSQWSISDSGSTNGTRLNGELLKPKDPHPVKIGDKIHLGSNPIHLVENEQSTENQAPVTVVSNVPLDHRTGEPLAPPPPAPPPPAPPPPAPHEPHEPPKTLADTLYLGASWLITPSTALGMVYRLVVLAVGAAVVVLVMGGAI